MVTDGVATEQKSVAPFVMLDDNDLSVGVWIFHDKKMQATWKAIVNQADT
jgi:hypothetical protein